VFQKRLDGSIDFYRGWNDYKLRFGNLNGEFWLGLDKIYRLTKSERYKLRVDLEDTAGKTAFAEYDMFAVTSESSNYQLGIGTYSGIPIMNVCPVVDFSSFVIAIKIKISLFRNSEPFLTCCPSTPTLSSLCY